MPKKIHRHRDADPQEGLDTYGDATFADPVNNKYPIGTPNPCSGTAGKVRAMNVVLRRVGNSLNANGDPQGEYDWRPLARGASAATLVVHGDRYPLPLAGSEEWVRVLPHARLVVIHDAGHYPHAEQPGQFFPPVEAFLSEERRR